MAKIVNGVLVGSGAPVRSDDGNQIGYFYKNITTTTTTVVKSTSGFLHTIVVNQPVASSVITIYDGVDTSGTKIGTITVPATLVAEGPQFALYDVWCQVGITIVTATGASDITVTYC